jgi:mitofilin
MFRHTAAAADDDEISVSNLSPFFLLDRAAQSIEKGDLQQAVRYANQLSGEPRRVAADWLREAKLLLETRQAADVLLAYAMAANTKSTA